MPFVRATNGRPYHRQFETRSGVWFRDVRRASNHAGALAGWHTPDGLLKLLALDVDAAELQLKAEPFGYLNLRDYQILAVQAVEAAITAGRRQALVAMATGTGKTRTVIGLIYRLLKAKRFQRVLFLVDRSSLGDQAQNAFKDARLEQNKRFTEIYDLKELGDITPDSATKVHVATVQGMARRLFSSDAGDLPNELPIDHCDCIIIDEAHRGYILDREMGEGELQFRDESDYISAYRRVLDQFDAVKIALTATPAQHTTQIFGKPVCTYTYQEAVIDGWLVDHLPPIRLRTVLAENGILYLAVATLAAHFILTFVFREWDSVTGGVPGTNIPRASLFGFVFIGDRRNFVLIFACALIAAMGARNLARTYIGRAFVVVRERDFSAELLGVHLLRTKLLAFAIGAFYAGVAGGLLGYFYGAITPEYFVLTLSVFYLAAAIVGGLGTVLGSVLGAVFMTFVPELLRLVAHASSQWFPGVAGLLLPMGQVVFGAFIIGFLVFEPHGPAAIWSRIRRVFHLWPFKT